MKSVLFAVMAIVILAAAGGGAYFYFQKPAIAAIGDDKAHQSAKKESADAKKSAKNEFVELSPLILPIIGSNGVTQTVSLVIVLEVSSSSKADMVRTLQPRLNDAFIQELYGVLNRHVSMNDGVLRVDLMKEKLYNISHKVMGEDVVEDVLLQVVQQRPI
jgi:flagellar FliL protein